MRFKKARKIYRIIFPANYTDKDRLENILGSSIDVQQFENKGNCYEVILKDNILLTLRNHFHSDIWVFQQIFSKKEYDLVLKMLQLNKISDDKIIIDAGANVGFTTVFFHRALKSSQFYLIEPDEGNADMIVKNTNHIPKERIKLYKQALSAESGDLFSLNKNFRDGKDWSLSTEPDTSGDITGISLNDIVYENKLDYISLLKIDIEGAERFIFEDKNDLSFLDLTQVLVIEIHDEFPARSNIYKILRERNFYLFENGELTIGINRNL